MIACTAARGIREFDFSFDVIKSIHSASLYIDVRKTTICDLYEEATMKTCTKSVKKGSFLPNLPD